MSKPWISQYPAGVPETINPDAYPNLAALFDEACERFAERPALTNYGTTLSYASWQKASRALAAYLHHELSCEQGTRIALVMPNCIAYPVSLMSCFYGGLVAVNVNPLYTSEEMHKQFKDAGVEVVIVLDTFAKTVSDALAGTMVRNVIVAGIPDFMPWPKCVVTKLVMKLKKLVPKYELKDSIGLPHAIRQGARLPAVTAQYDNTALAILQYTGGTTGVSKGAMLTHRNLVANLLQVESWFKSVIESGKEVIITPLPLYHIFSLTVNCLAFMKFGAENVLITNPRDLNAFIKLLQKTPFSAISGVNTLFNSLLNHSEFSACDFSRLRFAIAGGMAVQEVVAKKWQDLTGAPLLEGYGLTETSPVVTANAVTIKAHNGTIGLPMPSTDVKVCDEEGDTLPIGEAGELYVRGPQVMQGYWQQEAETAKVLSPDGWFATGDIATMRGDGRLRIVDRKKDMILVSGFNVYPNEVEDLLAGHPKVLEVAVVGVPNEKTGESVKVVIVKKEDDLTAPEIKEFCRLHLAGYKVPRIIEFADSLPKTNVGKVLRRALR